MFPNQRKLILILAGALLLSACSAPPAPTAASTAVPARSGALTPFVPRTATVTATPVDASTPAPLPSPSPTPRTHVVKKGEDMGGIAYRYHVTVPELLEANPTVNPNLMSVGTVLTIPFSKTPEAPSGPSASNDPATPTPIPLELGRLNCTRSQEGGAWCFLPVKNQQGFALEGITAVIRVADKDAHTIIPLSAFLPLDVLPPGTSLPVSAYFPPKLLGGLAEPLQFGSDLVSALPSSDDGRYLKTEIKNQKVLVSADGLSAEVQMDVSLPQVNQTAKRIWVAAVAYDTRGDIVGVRRWENAEGQSLQSGKPIPVSMRVYSTGGAIDHVTVLAEARP